MIELRTNEKRRRGTTGNETMQWDDPLNEYDDDDDELDFFGIVPPKKRPDSVHPYDKDGNYIPRNARR